MKGFEVFRKVKSMSGLYARQTLNLMEALCMPILYSRVTQPSSRDVIKQKPVGTGLIGSVRPLC